MDGYGVYTIKMQLYPCLPASYVGTIPDWWKGMEMGFKIERKASCTGSNGSIHNEHYAQRTALILFLNCSMVSRSFLQCVFFHKS